MLPLSRRAAALLEQFPGPVTIRYSKWLYIFMFICFAVGAGSFTWLVWRTWPGLLRSTEAMVYLAVLVSMLGPLLVVALISLAKGLPRIVLDANGLAFEALLASYERRWCDIDRFKARVIYVGLSDAARPQGFWDKLNAFGSFGRRIIFAMFEMRSKELAQLFTAWRERALAVEQAPYGSSSVSQ